MKKKKKKTNAFLNFIASCIILGVNTEIKIKDKIQEFKNTL